MLFNKKIGISPIKTIERAAREESSNISSLAYWYTVVLSVSKLKGLNNNVIGSS